LIATYISRNELYISISSIKNTHTQTNTHKQNKKKEKKEKKREKKRKKELKKRDNEVVLWNGGICLADTRSFKE
jgi:hypothetical protein